MFCFFRLAKRNSVKTQDIHIKMNLKAARNKKSNTDDTGRTDENGLVYSALQSRSVKIRLIRVIRVLHRQKMFFENQNI